MFNKLRIRKHEVGLWFRHGDFKGLLNPGSYILPGRYFGKETVQVVNRLDAKFDHKLIDTMIDHPQVTEQTIRIELADDERALLWKDGRLSGILSTGRHVYWGGPAKIEVERFNVNDFEFTHKKLDAVLALPIASRYFDGVTVEPGEKVLLYRDGQLERELGPGLFVNWKGAGRVERKIVDLREQVLDVSGQEIMSADKVTLRVNLLVNYRVADARKAAESVGSYEQALYREAQLALREAVGGRALDKLLADKDQLGSEVRNALASRGAEFGLKIEGAGLRDVILPGDMKSILNEVILAQKQAEANLIRR
ncbi:MAG: slipin family protein, partial [Planctomycetota bacterium]